MHFQFHFSQLTRATRPTQRYILITLVTLHGQKQCEILLQPPVYYQM